MQHRGFYFSLEILITLILILMIFLMPMQNFDSEIEDVFVVQKMHDLLLIWSKQRDFSENTLKSDFEFVFPSKSGIIETEGKKIEINKFGITNRNKIVEKINYIGENFEYKKIILTVFN